MVQPTTAVAIRSARDRLVGLAKTALGIDAMVYAEPSVALESQEATVLRLASELEAELAGLADATPSQSGVHRSAGEARADSGSNTHEDGSAEVAGVALARLRKARAAHASVDASVMGRLSAVEELRALILISAVRVEARVAAELDEASALAHVEPMRSGVAQRRLFAPLLRAIDEWGFGTDAALPLRRIGNALTGLIGNPSFASVPPRRRAEMIQWRERILGTIREVQSGAVVPASLRIDLLSMALQLRALGEMDDVREHDADVIYRTSAGLRWLVREGNAVPDQLFRTLKLLEGASEPLDALIQSSCRDAAQWLDAMRLFTTSVHRTGPLARRPR